MKKGKKILIRHKRKNRKVKELPQVRTTTKFVTKKGKLKGRNKKETRLLKAACTHHIYVDGELVAPIYTESNGTRVCELCGKVFSAQFYNKSELHQTIDPTIELSNQMKFMAVAVGASESDVDMITKGHVYLTKMPKIYKKLTKVAAVESRVGKKKKGKKAFGTMQYGSWR